MGSVGCVVVSEVVVVDSSVGSVGSSVVVGPVGSSVVVGSVGSSVVVGSVGSPSASIIVKSTFSILVMVK